MFLYSDKIIRKKYSKNKNKEREMGNGWNGYEPQREKETLKRDIYLISIYIGRHFMDIGSSMMIVQHDDR